MNLDQAQRAKAALVNVEKELYMRGTHEETKKYLLEDIRTVLDWAEVILQSNAST